MENQPEDNPTAAVERKASKQGKKAKARQQEKFRAKKNAEFQKQLDATLLKRLGVTDPTNVAAIKPQSSIVPSRIPVSFRGLPTLVKELWLRMKAIGTRPFASLATDDNYAIFLKCTMFICEAKLTYAQMTCEVPPAFPMTSLNRFSEMELRCITMASKRLPFPIALYVECLGTFTSNNQTVVPVLATTSPSAASGAVSFSPVDLGKMFSALTDPQPVDDTIAVLAQCVDELPKVAWDFGETTHQPPALPNVPPEQQPRPVTRNTVSASAATRSFWSEFVPSNHDWLIFQQIVASMDSKRGFNIPVDIRSGLGSIVQAIRFPEPFDPDQLSVQYYMNVDIPEFEEQLAPAFQIGYEYQTDHYSRFISDYYECFKHGEAVPSEARYAVIWASKEPG